MGVRRVADHEVVDLVPVGWQPVNGHEPIIRHNVTTKRANVQCKTCGWISQTRSYRYWDLLGREWRTHAGDLAVGLTIRHGQLDDNGCHCVTCLLAERDARRQQHNAAAGFTAVNPAASQAVAP
jgi:hypothetical protein